MAKEETEDGLKINWDLFTQLIVNRFRLAIGFGMGNLHEAFGYHKVMKEKDIWEIDIHPQKFYEQLEEGKK